MSGTSAFFTDTNAARLAEGVGMYRVRLETRGRLAFGTNAPHGLNRGIYHGICADGWTANESARSRRLPLPAIHELALIAT